MKKFVVLFALVSTLAVAFIFTRNVYAQDTTPPEQTPGGYGYGRGLMGGQAVRGDGILHDAMITVYSEKLGISVDELNTRLSNGETLAEIAAAKGLTVDQIIALRSEARTLAIDQAVKDGTITQAQAEWMKQRGVGGMMGSGRGSGRGMHGVGPSGNRANCPYFNQPNQ